MWSKSLSNTIVEDEEKWEWEWNNQKRDRCDRVYSGDLSNCNSVLIGDDYTRGYCDKYENKCLGNSRKSQDVNCYEVDKIPKKNAYDIDIVGDIYDSCCEEFNALSLLREDTNKSRDQREEKLKKILMIDEEDSNFNNLRDLFR